MDLFSAIARSYDIWYETPLGAFVERLEMEALDDVLGGSTTAGWTLEAGAGTGRVTAHLWALDRHVIALEPSPAMLATGRRRTGGLPVTWVLGRAETLPYQRDTIDDVLFFTSLEFIDSPTGAVSEALRVLRPGGRLVVGFLTADSPWGWLYRRLGEAGEAPWSDAHFFSLEELEALVGFPALTHRGAVHLSPDASPPFDEAESAGRLAGIQPALEVASWKTSP